jgi:hypothetical protein
VPRREAYRWERGSPLPPLLGRRIAGPIIVANEVGKLANLGRELHFDFRLDSNITLSGGGTRLMANKVNLSEARGEVAIIWNFWSPSKPASTFNISNLKRIKDPIVFQKAMQPLIDLLAR